jgi:hypothetical protein
MSAATSISFNDTIKAEVYKQCAGFAVVERPRSRTACAWNGRILPAGPGAARTLAFAVPAR